MSERRSSKLLKEQRTLLRRDIAKTLEVCSDNAAHRNWGSFQSRFDAIADLPKNASKEAFAKVVFELKQLWNDVCETLSLQVDVTILSANAADNERHIQRSKTESFPTDERSYGPATGKLLGTSRLVESSQAARQVLDLDTVLKACPKILEFAVAGPIRDWADLCQAADLARRSLQVASNAWFEATEVMGLQEAATVMAAIVQRSHRIHKPGGYLRDLTKRARLRKFLVQRMIAALLGTNRVAEYDAAMAEPHSDGLSASGLPPSFDPIEISPILLKSMAAKRR